MEKALKSIFGYIIISDRVEDSSGTVTYTDHEKFSVLSLVTNVALVFAGAFI